MCHNSASESDQIDKCIENGMPHKIIKTVKYTMRRRVAEAAVVDDTPKHVTELETRQKDKVRNDGAVIAPKGIVKASRAIQMKCPFSHGLKTPTPTTSPSDSPPLGPLAETAELQIPKLFGGLIHRQSIGLNDNSTADDDVVTGITNLSGHGELIPAEEDIYNDDILAKSTQFTKKLTFHMQQAIGRLQESKIYTLLTKTTQPAHVLAICIPSFVLLTIWPEIIDGTQHKHAVETKDDHNSSVNKNYTLALIAYLGAFSTHFGSQIWMTFVSGLSLYFSLPRHMFGQCQQILFPKYFAMNGVLSITMLILFVKFFVDSWTMPQCVQLGALSLTGAIEVLVRLYLAPPLLYLMHEKYKIEGTIGSGKEVGSLVQGDLIQCPHYQRIHKAFRRIHMTVAIGNLITMAASCLHLYYIAGKIQISI